MEDVAEFPASREQSAITAIFIVAIFTDSVDSCCQTLFGLVAQLFFLGETGHHQHVVVMLN